MAAPVQAQPLVGMILCISLFTGLPVASPPAVVFRVLRNAPAYYVPFLETVVLREPSSWLLAWEVTHHLQSKAGVRFDERQASDAARHYVNTCEG